MKSFITIILLFAIGVSFYGYFSNAEDTNDRLLIIGAPIIVEVLLVLILVFSPRDVVYRRHIRIAFIVWTLVTATAFGLYGYLAGMAQAFKN